jgi:tetratricopeptide (TPR) repeat protein
VLNKKGEHAKAIDECEEAIRLRPDYAAAHANLGNALHAVGRLDEAMVEWHKAIRLQPDLAEARNNLGSALGNQGKLEQAIDQFREANRLTPEYPDAHWNLGVSLLRRGDYAGAVDSLRKARELAGPEPDRRFPGIGQALVEAERCVALADRLPAILKGDDAPKDNAERLFLGLLCYKVKHYAAAARHWNDAFESDPKLADDHAAFNRYNAACVAALAGCGQGDDAPTDEAAKAKLRGQALDWLRIELPHGALNHWLGDSDLADVRDADALEKLPESERAAWQALWSEVNERLKQTK